MANDRFQWWIKKCTKLLTGEYLRKFLWWKSKAILKKDCLPILRTKLKASTNKKKKNVTLARKGRKNITTTNRGRRTWVRDTSLIPKNRDGKRFKIWSSFTWRPALNFQAKVLLRARRRSGILALSNNGSKQRKL